MEVLDVDTLVCGGGMSGMACAAFAAEAGARTLVVEKQTEIGGSSSLSAGMFWAPHAYDKLRSWVPDGDPTLQRAWLNEYLPAVQWMRENGIPTAKRFDGIMTIGIGFPIKIPELHKAHQQRVAASKNGSRILTNTSVVKLTQENPGVPGSRVNGAIICEQKPGCTAVYYQVKAKLVVLATGGFQGSPSMTAKYLGQGGDNIFVRSNKGSVGDGLNLAIAAGAGTSRGLNTFYGHLLAAPVRAGDVNPQDYLPLAQYQSKYCMLLNESGRRFADETMGDEIVNQYLAKQEKRRGFLLFNEKTRLRHCTGALFPNAGDVDRLQKAREYGCHVAKASTLRELLEVLRSWGVDHVQAGNTIERYHQVVGQGQKNIFLDAPAGGVGAPPRPLVDGEGPFYAMEVQPSITFTYGGISVDTQARALTHDQNIVPGLLVAGVDAGGFSNLGYAGGLALAFVTGLWAARSIARELGLVEPYLPPADSSDAAPLQSRL
ncbi:extracellular 3-ketosteroid 1-dehydrogenase [Penicillium brasilianum]|uniref:Extracellular 3-ketosteroid 1-dehydrogenase n=1 Tax=Penicillium brasilianum TaxID=104259 RepID=A0A1S9RBI9_PENBI|nr:extracellular 3-ketosteroid 1-dehydrogenase [Penicillium brasilianum]